MTLADPVLATKYVLEASADVAAACGGTPRVYGSKLPSDAVAVMPRSCIVVKTAGGGSIGVGVNDTIAYSVRRLDVWCYGSTDTTASDVAIAVSYALKRWRIGTIRQHRIHAFTYSSGPIQFDDPDFDWPVQVVTFLVQLADELTA